MKNIAVFIALGLIGVVLALYGCGGEGAKKQTSAPVDLGASTYKKYCTACHGSNGKMGLNGAANLAATTLTHEEAVQVITNGRKMMASYKSILSKEEINEVANYVLTLKE